MLHTDPVGRGPIKQAASVDGRKCLFCVAERENVRSMFPGKCSIDLSQGDVRSMFHREMFDRSFTGRCSIDVSQRNVRSMFHTPLSSSVWSDDASGFLRFSKGLVSRVIVCFPFGRSFHSWLRASQLTWAHFLLHEHPGVVANHLPPSLTLSLRLLCLSPIIMLRALSLRPASKS